MIVFLDEGLGNGSYLVEVASGRAVLVDPDRRADRYIHAASERGLEIVAVFDTHLHADFVTGSLEVRAATGATIHLPKEAGVGFAHRAVTPGGRVSVGDVEIEVMHTPGHAPEHVAYVIRRASGDPPALFSGGALIVGGAARTDLVSPELTERLTRAEFHTLAQAFTGLPDESPLYPTHGGGSFCSAGGGDRHTSTLGEERASNPLLALHDEEDFVRSWPATFPPTPAYFSRMRAVNRAGPRLRSEIRGPARLSADEFDRARRSKRALVVDCRGPDEYAAGHIEGSLAIPFRPAFPTWLGWLAPEDAEILLVADGMPPDEVVGACLLVGCEWLAGFLEGGLSAWRTGGFPVRSLPTIGPEDAVPWLEMGAQPLDVREEDEFETGHVAGAMLAPLGRLDALMELLPTSRPILTYCAAGLRSVSGASLLERAGIGPVVNLRGGYGAWQSAHRD